MQESASTFYAIVSVKMFTSHLFFVFFAYGREGRFKTDCPGIKPCSIDRIPCLTR